MTALRNSRRRRGNLVRPQFYKMMPQSTIRFKKLVIPDNFAKDFGEELSQIATLTVPNGRSWRVAIRKVAENLWFHGDGWLDFVDCYGISLGNALLVFRYEGDSLFHVRIFDNVSGYQIDYPSEDDEEYRSKDHVETKSEKRNSNGTDDDPDYDTEDVKPLVGSKNGLSSKGKRMCDQNRDDDDKQARGKNSHKRSCVLVSSSKACKSRAFSSEITTNQDNESDYQSDSSNELFRCERGKEKVNATPAKRDFSVEQDDRELYLPRTLSNSYTKKKEKKRVVKDEDRYRTINVASRHKLNNPAFIFALRPNYSPAYVPADFARKYLSSCPKSITLEGPKGEQSTVTCCYSHSTQLIGGWPKFIEDNNLGDGDVCVFELIDKKKLVLKVWIYRVADYESRGKNL